MNTRGVGRRWIDPLCHADDEPNRRDNHEQGKQNADSNPAECRTPENCQDPVVQLSIPPAGEAILTEYKGYGAAVNRENDENMHEENNRSKTSPGFI